MHHASNEGLSEFLGSAWGSLVLRGGPSLLVRALLPGLDSAGWEAEPGRVLP